MKQYNTTAERSSLPVRNPPAMPVLALSGKLTTVMAMVINAGSKPAVIMCYNHWSAECSDVDDVLFACGSKVNPRVKRK